ncbi:MAG: ChrR family anti-sigma-E factor [Pseudomonadota bacterium]
MTVRHHPDETLLLGHAAGGLDSAMSLVVATHLSFCSQCRADVALLERGGAALLDDLAPAALAGDALARTLARLDTAYALPAVPASNDNTPAPLRAFLGRDLSGVHWRKMGPQLGYVNLVRRGPLALRLLRGAPGSDVGRHSHRGMEYTLVLRGGFSDETGSYGPGDFQTASPDVTHNPVADHGEDCINLAVTTERLVFDGMVQRVVGRLFGF